jgi:DNA-binding SARP family transcriptional activator
VEFARGLEPAEKRAEAVLDAGRHCRVIGELTTLTAEHPLRERFTAMLMPALCRAGRQADALDAFGRLAHRQRDDLGLDPNPGIQRLHIRILEGLDTRAIYCFES